MKFLVLFILIISMGAQAAELKKTFDGVNARCNLPADAGNSAYRLKITGEKQFKTTKMVSLDISFLKCQETATGMALVAAKGDEVTLQKTILSTGEEALVERKILSFSLTAFTESGKLLDKILIENLSQSRAKAELRIESADLSANDEIFINGLGVEAAKLSTDPEENASIREFIGGTYKLR